ncbi:Thiamine-phosphate synthase [Brevundimonas sp. SH203]|uniref:thiamine phosphate synthase n=1 Tax=Brevundimonas sp. SH203 TaxID=345167 RepID=UPI0009C6274A|nr:thiamine phosphate synthase [Brevundimonas sp. SH203]GAW42323.1 Thiamine-phosphate synthase [Brevundimonas sp. SH203]
MILPAGYSDDARTLWNVATALNRAAAAVSPAAVGLPPLLFFTDPARTPRPWATAVRLPAGSAVIYRAFGATDAVETGRKLREATTKAGVRLLVGLDVHLAQAVSADGLHLPERSADQAPVLRAARPDWLLTAAWHGEAAPPTGLDALVLSPVFPAGGASASKPALGVDGFATHAAQANAPVYALGGIEAKNAGRIVGACGLAGVDAIRRAFGEPPKIRI